MQYGFRNEYKITNSQKPEFEKSCFFSNLGRLSICTKSLIEYLESYFGFGSEKLLNNLMLPECV